jgi:hypothetical protein
MNFAKATQFEHTKDALMTAFLTDYGGIISAI